jgi:FtsH-binding integral membrane protein
MGISYAPATRVRSGVERATLVRRTYGLVFLNVLVTMLGVAFTATQPALFEAAARHPWIAAICWIIPMFMAQRSAREFPKNIILTFLATFIIGIALAPLLYMVEARTPGVVAQAGILTFVAFGALSLYALFSRRDFSAWGGFFIVGAVVLLVAMIINMFVQSAAADVWISAVGVMVFGGLLVFDTWRLLRSGELGQDDYVLATVNIYMDLLNMFLFILRLLSGRSRD